MVCVSLCTYICRHGCQKQVSQAWISNCIPKNTVQCNYLYSWTITLLELMFLLIKPILDKVYLTLLYYFTYPCLVYLLMELKFSYLESVEGLSITNIIFTSTRNTHFSEERFLWGMSNFCKGVNHFYESITSLVYLLFSRENCSKPSNRHTHIYDMCSSITNSRIFSSTKCVCFV